MLITARVEKLVDYPKTIQWKRRPKHNQSNTYKIFYVFFSQVRTGRLRLGRNPAGAPEVVVEVSNSRAGHVRTQNHH